MLFHEFNPNFCRYSSSVQNIYDIYYLEYIECLKMQESQLLLTAASDVHCTLGIHLYCFINSISTFVDDFPLSIDTSWIRWISARSRMSKKCNSRNYFWRLHEMYIRDTIRLFDKFKLKFCCSLRIQSIWNMFFSRISWYQKELEYLENKEYIMVVSLVGGCMRCTLGIQSGYLINSTSTFVAH